jgi:hypothetical protein
MSRCDECGWDWDSDVDADAIRAYGDRIGKPLTRFLPSDDPDAVLRTRPAPGVWSALEYAGHVQDVFDFYGERIERVLNEERPQLSPGGDWDAMVIDAGYNEADPTELAAQVASSADRCAALVDNIAADTWARVGIGSAGEERTVMELARRAAQDAHHHLLDIGRVMRHVRQTI